MSFLACMALLSPLITGYAITYSLLPLQRPSFHLHVLATALAIGIACGMTSCAYFLLLPLFGTTKMPLAIYDVISCLAFSALLLPSFRGAVICDSPSTHEGIHTGGKFKQVLTIGFVAALICSIGNAFLRSTLMPHGSWDAWTIWNLRARFLYRGASQWADAFSTLLAPHHPDYPLLIPALIARCWQYTGKETQVVPAAIGIWFVYASIGLLTAALFTLRSRCQGLLAGLVLLGTPYFLIIGIYQLADVPLGFYFLATMVLFCFQDRMPERYGISTLAGMMAGFACWTKNEGLLFLLSIIIARLAVILFTGERKKKAGQMILFIAGFTPALLVLCYFKVHFAPANDLFAGQDIHALTARLMDFSRYRQVAQAFLTYAEQTVPVALVLAIYPCFTGITVDKSSGKTVITSLMVVLLTCMGYFVVYVISPHDLEWHLRTSLPRLLMQLWPSIIFTYFLMVNTPEEIILKQNKVTPLANEVRG